MKVTITYKSKTQSFDNKEVINIGKDLSNDFILDDFEQNESLKLLYTQQYKNYILINTDKSQDLKFNNKTFSKLLISPNFMIMNTRTNTGVKFEIEDNYSKNNSALNEKPEDLNISNISNATDDDIEHCRTAVIKEVGTSISEYKGNISSMTIANMIANIAILLLSVTSAFGVTNFLLGLKVDTTSSVLNLTTNFGFLACLSLIILAISFILKHGVFTLLSSTAKNKYGSTAASQFMVGASSLFLIVIYVMNLFYYKTIPGFFIASLFIALLFVGTLTIASIGSGYFKFQINENNKKLMDCEYREDFEAIMKKYRVYINQCVNKLSNNKINTVKSNLLNCQMRSLVEVFIGLLTAPFLAYGVSNTLASCFPEAANWVRISGLRFSPIFLVLATFLIIFAFFTFVRAFTIGKQIKASEIIKFDGFHDYNAHGVTILGLDAMRNLEKEKKVVLFIACFIIAIEFTMNVSYFITEMGGDMQGIFLSVVTALVPTALLIAETHMLSATMNKINNFNELLETLD